MLNAEQPHETVGARRPASVPIDLRTPDIQAWLQELPLADPLRCASRLTLLLTQSNEQALSASARLRFLEQLRTAIEDIGQSLEQNILPRTLPLTAKGLQHFDQLQGLFAAYLKGYRTVVVGLLPSRRSNDRKSLSFALYRCMSLLGRMLLVSYELYTPTPSKLWQALHHLYQIAERRDLLDRKIKDVNGIVGTIDEAYKRALLLSLTNPYSLRHGDVTRLNGALSRHAADLSIQAPRGRALAGLLCRVELDRDAPPRLAVDAAMETGSRCRLLSLDGLLRRLEQDVVTSASDHGTEEFTQVLLREVLQNWKGQAQRHQLRSPGSTSVRIAIGFNSTRKLFAPVTAGAVAQHSSEELSLVPFDAYQADSGRRWPSATGEQLVWNPDAGAEAGATHAELESRKAFQVKVVDVSARGYCLLWDHAATASIQVGELIAVQEHEGAGWRVGIVRWMQYLLNQGLKLGIEVLAASARPIAVTRVSEQPQEQFESLELSEVRSANMPATLLTPPDLFAVGDTLTVIREDRAAIVQLIQKESGASAERFRYKALTTLARRPAGLQ